MTYAPGSGGTSRISTSADVALNNATQAQVLGYNASIEKWENTTISGSGASVLIASATAPTAIKKAATHTCTGTNDELVINAALAGLSPAGGRVICWGLFNLLAPLRITSHGVTLEGVGTGARTNASQDSDATKFLASAGFVGDAIIRVESSTNDAPLQGVMLQNFTVDGDGIGSGVDGVLFRSHSAGISRVHVYRCSGNGINIKGYVNGIDGFTGTTWNAHDTAIERCTISHCTGSGLLFNTGAQDCQAYGLTVYSCQNNIRIRSASQQITNCHIHSAVDHNIWLDSAGHRTKIVNLKCETAGKHGIYMDSTNGGMNDVMVLASNFKNNGMSLHNTYSHIMIDGPAANGHFRTTIVGNNFAMTSDVANRAAYAINLASSAAQHSNIQANSFADGHFGTGPVNNVSTSTNAPLIQNNRGFVSSTDATVLVGGGGGHATMWFGGTSKPTGMKTGDYWIHNV